MSSISINGSPYTIYSTMALVNGYVNAMIGSAADAWNAADDDDKKGRCAVMATRLIDRQKYIDVANTFALRDAIQVFRDATAELAVALFADPSLYSAETSGKNIKRVDAGGGVGVEFFNPTLGISGRFPKQVQELLADYLDNAQLDANSLSGSYSSGADGTETSSFGPDVDFNLNGNIS